MQKNHLKSHLIRGIIKQILSVILYLQDRGIKHRDIKTESILFEEQDSLHKNAGEAGEAGLKILGYGFSENS